MQRRNFSQRPRFSLLPFFLLVSASIALWGMFSGSFGFAPVPQNVLSPTMQQRVVSDQVTASLAALSQGKSDEADRIAAQTIQSMGGSSDAYVTVSKEMVRQGHPSDAARLLVGATQKAELNWAPRLWAALAQAYTEAGNSTSAQAAQTQADRCGEAVLSEIGKQIPGKMPEAASAIEKFLQVGIYYTEEARDVKLGLRALREALRLMPDQPLTLNELGYTLADKGSTKAEFEEAKRLTLQAVNAAPGNGVILDSYGWALYKNHDLAGARRVLREAADTVPDIAEIHYHLAIVYRELGKIPDALLEFDRALMLKPNDPAMVRDRKATVTAAAAAETAVMQTKP